MNIFRLLVTKKIKASLVKASEAKGIEVMQKEFIRVVPAITEEKRKEIEKLFEEHVLVVFTSKNAVTFLASVAGNNLLAADGKWQIFCLEGATLQEVKKYFNAKNIGGIAPDAKKLAAEIAARSSGKHILFFCGDKRRDELPDTLKKKGYSINEMVIYRTEHSPEKISEAFDGVAFFSPSAVESFFSMNNVADNIVCFSVGDTTTATLKKFTKNDIVTISEPSEEKMMEAVEMAMGNGQ